MNQLTREVLSYQPLKMPRFTIVKSFAEAKLYNAHLVLKGDWGGQTYLTIPVSQLTCSELTLRKILRELDFVAWECNEGDGRCMQFIHFPDFDAPICNLDCDEVTDGLWLHPELENMREYVSRLLFGSGH